jgi:hypothetical protein
MRRDGLPFYDRTRFARGRPPRGVGGAEAMSTIGDRQPASNTYESIEYSK